VAAHKIQVAPELIAEGKRLHETTLTPLCDIAAAMGLSRGTLANRIREWGWKRRRPSSGTVDIFHAVRGATAAVATAETPMPATGVADPVSPQQRAALAQRIQNVVEREMTVIERAVGVLGPSNEAEAERTVRTLAGISRTLREIAALNRPDEVAPPDEADDDPVPRDLDEFRNELARRIRGFVEARRNGAGRISDEPEGSLE
jgi:hypothetical protein